MSSLKYKLEALLFSSARSMAIDELSRLTKAPPDQVEEQLKQLKKDYEQRDSSITFIEEAGKVKLNIKPEHVPIIQQIVTETELSKTLMETLAVIAFKYPIKQSDLIKMRTNKAYDHLRELEDIGYIIRQRYGRTKLIKLTSKFFEYFDLPPEKLKEKFEGFEGIAKAIGEKEEDIKKIKEEQKRKAKEAGAKEPEIDLTDKEGHKQKLEVYTETKQELEQDQTKEVKPYTDTLGSLEVTDVPEKKETETSEESEGIEMTEEMGEEIVDEIKEMVKTDEQAEETTSEDEPTSEEETKEAPSDQESTEEKTPKEIETEVDKKVEELLHPKKVEEEAEEPPEEASEKEEQKINEEPKDLLQAEPQDLLGAAAKEKKDKDEDTTS